MVKYSGPKVKIIRRLGTLPGLSTKISKKQIIKTPGQHGKILSEGKLRTSLSDDYKEQLLEKQKIRYNYGLSEKQLFGFFKKAKKTRGSSGQILLELLESRLDCTLFRLGFAPSISAARQLISHGHICVNNKMVNIPSMLCNVGDTISIKNNKRSIALVTGNITKHAVLCEKLEEMLSSYQALGSKYSLLLPKHLEILEAGGVAQIGRVLEKISREDVSVRVNELKVIEYYSK